MFHQLPDSIHERMRYLEAVDARDRQDGTHIQKRLRQIPPETGKFLALLAASAPPGQVLEIGTSGGYSSMWLALACRERGSRLVTFEILEAKAGLAQETFRVAGVEDAVQLVVGNAFDHLAQYPKVGFCFMDAEKNLYEACYEQVVPSLVKGGLFVADNAISHVDELHPFIEKTLADRRVDALVVPVGKGLLLCRKA